MDIYKLESYSQEGEDIVLKRIFEYKNLEDGGFYIDVGAHHPKRLSNTYFFYNLNWRGINIDATPNSMKEFDNIRPLDINLEYAISDKEEELTYYIFNEPALNSFDEKLSKHRDSIPHFNIIQQIKIRTKTLESVLEKHINEDQEIDFLTIDVEGLDFAVLKSNNWEKYSPKVVLIEVLAKDIDAMLDSDVYKFMKSIGYKYYAKTVGTHFFIREDFYKVRFL